jgi:hypothetical protein
MPDICKPAIVVLSWDKILEYASQGPDIRQHNRDNLILRLDYDDLRILVLNRLVSPYRSL